MSEMSQSLTEDAATPRYGKGNEVVQWSGSGKPSSVISGLMAGAVRRMHIVMLKRVLGSLGTGSSIDRPYYLTDAGAIQLGNKVKIWHHARLEALGPDQPTPKIRIGDRTVIQPYSHIGAARGVTIGANVLIASNVYITDHDHDWTDPAQPARDNGRLIVSPVTIHDYAWIGEKVTILKGVTIGERSIIGAGSVVTRDIPADCIAIGSPARVYKCYDREQQAWVPVKQS